MPKPEIVVERDYDGYFESLVQEWVERKEGEFKHHKIHIYSGPWRSSAVTYESKDGEIFFDFYSALRVGFGSLSSHEVLQIIDLL
jgi:hypothetical protein